MSSVHHGYRYELAVVDAKTGTGFLIPMHTLLDVTDAMAKAMVHIRATPRREGDVSTVFERGGLYDPVGMCTVQSDSAAYFRAEPFQRMLRRFGAHFQRSAPYQQSRNGIVERLN